MSLDRVVVRWDGFVGGPGATVMHVLNAPVSAVWLYNFFRDVKNFLPPTVNVTVPTEGFTIDVPTGHITGSWTAASTPVVVGAMAGTYAAAAGACVTWKTPTVGPHGLIRGKTFLVPLGGDAYDTDGTLLSTTRAAILTAAQSLITDAAGAFMIYRRPRVAGDPGGASPGVAAEVTGRSVADKSAVLRSRRD